MRQPRKPLRSKWSSGVVLRTRREERPDPDIVCACRSGDFGIVAYRCPDDEFRRRHPSDRGRRYIVGPQMNPCGAGCDCHVGPIIDNHWNPNRAYELSRDSDKIPCRDILQAELNARCSAMRSGGRARDQSAFTVPDMVGDRDESYRRGIDHRTMRLAIWCSARVVRNSWCPSEWATK